MARGSFRAADGTRLAYRDDGDGQPVLALAGLTRDGRDFDYLARHLGEGVRLVRLDSRGRGGSDWADPETYTVAQEAQDALALLDHLGIERAAVIGSSRGGLLAMVMAATAPGRVAGICFNDVGPVLQREGLALDNLLLDPGNRLGEFAGSRMLPTTLFFSADGRLVNVHLGELSSATLARDIAHLETQGSL